MQIVAPWGDLLHNGVLVVPQLLSRSVRSSAWKLVGLTCKLDRWEWIAVEVMQLLSRLGMFPFDFAPRRVIWA